jgi:cytochrome c-type biogenesis protein CcmH/NrfG
VLKRFHEARDAFDRACTLEPKRIEAMLLRREADRAARRLADTVGVARPMTIDLPEHLIALRDPLAAGNVDAVIPRLEQLTDDPAAQLVLAECFAYAQRYEESLGAYQRAAELPALRARATFGRARALLFLERANDALAELAGFEGRQANELRAMIRERLG